MKWIHEHKALCGWVLVGAGGAAAAIGKVAGVPMAQEAGEGLILVGTGLIGAGLIPSDKEARRQ